MSNSAQHQHSDARPTTARAINAVLGVALLVFCVVHVILGTAFWYGIIGDELAFAAWVGVGLVVFHIIMSITTTVSMFSDKKRPPSNEKKKHQILKWVTGILAVVLVALHLTIGDLVGNLYYSKGALIALVLLVLLSVHVYMGTKSLTHDLQLSPNVRKPFRIGVIFFCAFMATTFFLVSL